MQLWLDFREFAKWQNIRISGARSNISWVVYMKNLRNKNKYTRTYSLAHLLTRPLTYSLTYSLARSRTHSRTHACTHTCIETSVLLPLFGSRDETSATICPPHNVRSEMHATITGNTRTGHADRSVHCLCDRTRDVTASLSCNVRSIMHATITGTRS